MSTISLAMIVKNEEAVLERCLSSFKDLVDEIIIVDTGSTDNTKSIAKKYTENVYDFDWVDDFSKARNYSFSLCTKEYIMWADADDIFDQKQKANFVKLQKQLSNFDVVMLKYDIAFDQNNNPTFSYYRERILKNDKSFIWQDAVHEVIEPHGKIFYSDISIIHQPNHENKKNDRNLRLYQKLIDKGISLSNRQKYYYARELFFNNKFDEAIANFESFLNQKDIWKENAISACRDLAKCYLKINKPTSAKNSLIKSFLFDVPRAETCCALAEIFLNEGNYNVAIFWYLQATNCDIDIKSGAFVETDYYNIIPYLQLCFCYYKIGDIDKSKYYNDLAGKINPQNKAYLFNLDFFAKLK